MFQSYFFKYSLFPLLDTVWTISSTDRSQKQWSNLVSFPAKYIATYMTIRWFSTKLSSNNLMIYVPPILLIDIIRIDFSRFQWTFLGSVFSSKKHIDTKD